MISLLFVHVHPRLHDSVTSGDQIFCLSRCAWGLAVPREENFVAGLGSFMHMLPARVAAGKFWLSLQKYPQGISLGINGPTC